MFMLQYLLELVGSKIFLTGYVTGNSTFPKPLNEKEEKIYLERLKDGDVEAKRVLVERNLRLVAHIVKKYSSNYQNSKEMDDLISIGTIGLIKAIDSFDTNKGIRLATYAAKCIDNEILMFFRNTKKTKGEVFLQDPIGVDKEGNEIYLICCM
ncbi:RNA polymerase sigma-K factor [Clostridium perfringens B str. ATCC 3626]|uniref:RNA polymerase sigma-K factor n=1 Tax=Clostridium perfringens B str. ATCC 3626 TaxID=451754 RepID=A0AAV3BNG9_CLOPF|nr:RNA polymerase sigma-K factor [Clostridium perfringens B str. ATCC 3626]